MAISDIFKSEEYKNKILQLQEENKQLQLQNENHRMQILKITESITPSQKHSMDLQQTIIQQESKLAEITELLNKQQILYKNEQATYDELKAQVLIQKDLIELEDFALYEPKYQFQTSDEYKDALEAIREQQKQLIKNKQAVAGNIRWAINGNVKQGQKMVNDMKQLCLRAFNVECDSTITSVKFNNIDRCEKRIKKSFDSISKLGTLMDVQIVSDYYNLKLEELNLAYEYSVKKQDEKEVLRALRDQAREAAQVQKELDEARKKILKEQKHYQTALAQVKEQLSSCSTQDQRIELSNKFAVIKQQCQDIETNLENIDYRSANQKAGYVYVISNLGAFGKDVYKIGMTRRLEPTERIDELSGASVPFKFDIHALIFSDDAPALEATLHKAFESKKMNMINSRKEFFHVSLSEIKKIVLANHDKTVEFTEFAPAEQYRETLKILNSFNLE